MAKAFLVVGSTGAGKSTYSRALAQKENAQVFSIDEWMTNLFWMDAPPGGDLGWALERVRRCETQIWHVASRLLLSNRNVVLDLGFAKKDQRDRFRSLILGIQQSPELHFLDIPAEIRKQRVLKRNQEKPDTFQFEVKEETFDWFETDFERPSEDEQRGAIVVNV